MKVLTLWQPWAQFVAKGIKQVETRCWSTKYRGPLLIHAAKRKPEPDLTGHLLSQAGYRGFPLLHGGEWPLGCIIGYTYLENVIPTEQSNEVVSERERVFGDYSAGRFAWLFGNTTYMDPIPVRGHQRLWNLSPELEEKIRRPR